MTTGVPDHNSGRILLMFSLFCCISETLMLHHQATDIHDFNTTLMDTLKINTGPFNQIAVLKCTIPAFLPDQFGDRANIIFCHYFSFCLFQCTSFLSIFLSDFTLYHPVCYLSSSATSDIECFVLTSVVVVVEFELVR